MIWNCVEERIDNGTKYGRIVRKVLFGEIYADRKAVLSRNPIPIQSHPLLKQGDKIAFYEDNGIREGEFLCSSTQDQLDPMYMVAELLPTEDDLKFFCEANGLKSSNLIIMAIEAYKYLTNLNKIDVTTRKRASNDETETDPSPSKQQIQQPFKVARLDQVEQTKPKRRILPKPSPPPPQPKQPVLPTSTTATTLGGLSALLLDIASNKLTSKPKQDITSTTESSITVIECGEADDDDDDDHNGSIHESNSVKIEPDDTMDENMTLAQIDSTIDTSIEIESVNHCPTVLNPSSMTSIMKSTSGDGYSVVDVGSSERGKFIFTVNEPGSINRRYYLHYVNATQLKLRCVRYKYACKATLKVLVPAQYITTQLIKGRRRFDIDATFLLSSEAPGQLIVETVHNEHICDTSCPDRLKTFELMQNASPSLVLNGNHFK